MPEGEKPEAGEGGQEPNSQDQTQVNPGETNETWEDGSTFDVEKAKAALVKLRAAEKEARELKKQRDTLDAEVRAFKQAQLSDTERMAAENAEMKAKVELLERQARETQEREQITSEARRLGFIDEDDAFRLVDRARLQVEEATGRISNLQSVLNELLQAKPHLKSDGPPEAQQRSTITPTPSRQATPNLNEVAESNRALLQSSGRYAS